MKRANTLQSPDALLRTMIDPSVFDELLRLARNSDALLAINNFTDADRIKLDEIEEGATADMTRDELLVLLALTKADIGLDQVDNTSDLNKPISIATQAAIDAVGAQSSLTPYTMSDGSSSGEVTIQQALELEQEKTIFGGNF